MSHGERARKRNCSLSHDWHMKQNGMTGRRPGNPAHDYRNGTRAEKTSTHRKERRMGDRITQRDAREASRG